MKRSKWNRGQELAHKNTPGREYNPKPALIKHHGKAGKGRSPRGAKG